MARKPMAGTGSGAQQRSTEEELDGGFIRRASSAIGRLFGRKQQDAPAETPVRSSRAPEPTAQHKARATRRTSDIELDVLERTYTPGGTSGKAGFRSDGADHQRDQEFALGVSDERWNDEDRYTNKSGDPRIGTHGRTYEPGEARTGDRNR